MRSAFFVGACWLAATACSTDPGQGDSRDVGGNPAVGNATAATGGSSNAPGSGGAPSNPGGTTSSATGGTSSTGGATGQAGTTVVPGNPCTANCPTGTLYTCFGVGCPISECDNARFFASALCSTVYPAPIDSSTIFCTAGENSSYCLDTLDRSMTYWMVTCTDGTPVFEKCVGGCGTTAEGFNAHC
jgi:hypothetical protein